MISCRGPSTANQNATKKKTTKLSKARENAADQSVVGLKVVEQRINSDGLDLPLLCRLSYEVGQRKFKFASDWWRERCEFPGPITKRSNAKTIQSRIAFDTQLKIALLCRLTLLALTERYDAQKNKQMKKKMDRRRNKRSNKPICNAKNQRQNKGSNKATNQ